MRPGGRSLRAPPSRRLWPKQEERLSPKTKALTKRRTAITRQTDHISAAGQLVFLAMGDHITANIDPSEVVFVSIAVLMTIALTPRVLRFGQRRGWFKR